MRWPTMPNNDSTPDPVEIPKPNPETTHRINVILIGGKRYAIDVSTRTFELKPKPAEVVTLPERS
jgi:hypothetical protein